MPDGAATTDRAAPRAAGAAFDLLVDGWIPVLSLDGASAEVGLLECLERAPELREVADPSPLVTFGLHRFLGAILQTYLELPDESAWAEEWERGRFDPSLVDRVREGCARRLRLFDPDHPFYQSRDVALPPPAGGKIPSNAKTVGYLYAEASTATNVVHFSHAGDDAHAYCPACSARGLLTLPPFATAGGAGIKPSINGVPPVYLLPSGRNLFETLLLNYVLPPFRPHQAASEDPGPVWAGDGVVGHKQEKSRVGFVESLTWPARRVRLFPSIGGPCSRCGRTSDVLVRKMVFAQGLFRPKDLPVWDDPWVAYRVKRDKAGGAAERVAIRPQEGKALWRDFASLFLLDEGQTVGGSPATAARPSLLRQIDHLLTEEVLPEDAAVRFHAFGMRTDMKAKVFEWRESLFDFPPAVLKGKAAAPVEGAIKVAETAADCLRSALRHLHPISDRQKPDRDALRAALKATVERAQREYWQRLEPVFRAAIADARLRGPMAGQARWLEEWQAAVRERAVRILEETIESGGFDSDAEALARQVKARRELNQRLAAALRPIATQDGGPAAPGGATAPGAG